MTMNIYVPMYVYISIMFRTDIKRPDRFKAVQPALNPSVPYT